MDIQAAALISQAAALILGAIYFVGRELHARSLERGRTQPIVLVNEDLHPRRDGIAAAYRFVVHLTNDGEGNAFNIRFGVDLNSQRFEYRAGSRNRDNLEGAAAELTGKLWDGRRYWARYENARGQTWEAVNPWDPTQDLTVKRIRLLGVRAFGARVATLLPARARSEGADGQNVAL